MEGESPSFVTDNKSFWKTIKPFFSNKGNYVSQIKLIEKYDSLGARDGFIQPIFLQKVRLLQFVNQIKWIKKTVVSCDVTRGITLGTKLNMPIFTLYLPHNLESTVLVFQKFM